ncbi:DMT family transporter [Georgenia alba]|uniref:DMT family transporter n=1 Tax=Georgenia alba TaxID=2233858 RepID=A0ABW2QDL1_9MICO
MALSTRTALTGLVAEAGLILTWSSGFIGAHLGTRYAPAGTLLTWRYVAAAVLFVVVLAALRRGPVRDRPARHVALGILCQAGYVGGVVTGIGLGVPAGTAALIAALQPLVVAALARRMPGERQSGRQLVGLAVGVVGVALVVSGDLGAASGPAWAYALPLAGTLSLSVGTVLAQRWQLRDGLVDSLGAQTVVVAVSLVVGAAATDGLRPPAEPGFWLAVLWVVVLSTFGGYGCYFLVLRRRGPTRLSTLLYLTPPCTMLWAAAMLGERPTVMGYVGTAVCALAVAVVLRRGRAVVGAVA